MQKFYDISANIGFSPLFPKTGNKNCALLRKTKGAGRKKLI